MQDTFNQGAEGKLKVRYGGSEEKRESEECEERAWVSYSKTVSSSTVPEVMSSSVARSRVTQDPCVVRVLLIVKRVI